MFISQFRSHPLSADKNFNAKQQNSAKIFRDRTNEKEIKLSLSRLFFYVILTPSINLSRNKFIRDLYIINSTSIHFMWKKILKQKNIVRTFRGKDKIIIVETIFFKIYKIHILRYINPSRSKFIQNRNVRIEQIKNEIELSLSRLFFSQRCTIYTRYVTSLLNTSFVRNR